MQYKSKIILIKSVFLALLVLFSKPLFSEDVKAACTTYNFQTNVLNAGRDVCNSCSAGSCSWGTAVYNCVTDGFGDEYCSTHEYTCDSSCSGSGPPSGGGGSGGSCARPTVNCPPGTTRGTVRQTMYTCATSRPTGCPALGSAQRYETALNSSGNPNYGCGSCYWEEDDGPFISCDFYRVGVYNCVSTTPTCTIDIVPQTIAAGTSSLFPASIPTSSGTITQVDFVSSNPAVATVTTPDTTASYSSTATGIGAGTTTITASVVMSGSVRCTDTAIVTVTNTPAWWQVKDGDLTAGSGGSASHHAG